MNVSFYSRKEATFVITCSNRLNNKNEPTNTPIHNMPPIIVHARLILNKNDIAKKINGTRIKLYPI